MTFLIEKFIVGTKKRESTGLEFSDEIVAYETATMLNNQGGEHTYMVVTQYEDMDLEELGCL